ncbi:unnamed protein product [Rotaria sordida]|uniref:F-box domain-containing protein n=1 Tax=Rotaria sordida TaxID=392033 RepID=A0A815RTK8_9BILA|nr:unnamed protein product [Rotaria sordida]CAF1481651.1 unnamed protein product [Rotaria sordida]
MINSCIGLNDLPDEILMIIFKKLNNIDILYSFYGANQRLNKIIHDPTFTSCLTFVEWSLDNFIDLLSCKTILNQFCFRILPEIHNKIKWLGLESSSMKHVLRAAHYPNLDSLGLYNIDEESIRCLFTDETLSSGIFKNQITTLVITINRNDDYFEMLSSVVNIYDYIFSVFTHLIVVALYESSYKDCVRLCFNDSLHPNIRSSTLLKLNIKVQCFNDCLYLLDGRFNQLHTFYVDLVRIRIPQEVENQGDLPNLKCFSLSSNYEIYDYDELVLPLLNRMSNLEQLGLYLLVYVNETFIDGNHLKKKIINGMPRLNQFTFYIRSSMYTGKAKESQCHIYSYPPLMEYYGDITNDFPGGLFEYVRVVSLNDEHPFEHEFFLRIQKSFPFMEQLTVINHKPQNRKQSYESNIDNQNLSVIEYFFLNTLDIINTHDDYIEEFLFDTKTYFQNNVYLQIHYESLKRVTHNFTRDATRVNSTKINKLYVYGGSKCSNSLQEYFPYAKIFH